MAFQLDPNMKLGYTQIRVLDLPKQKAYYEKLGFQLLNETESEVVFGAGSSDAVLILKQEDGSIPRPPRTTGLFHFAILVPSREALAHVIGNVAQQGIPFSGAGDHLYSEAFYLTDPEGNGVEIYRDRPKSEWTIHENGMIDTDTLPVDVEDVLSLYDPAADWNGFPEGTILGHMHLNVSVLDSELEHFYFDVLGFDLKTNFHNSAYFISAGGYHHHIAMNVWAGVGAAPSPPNASGLISFSLNMSSESKLEELRQQLQKENVSFIDEKEKIIVKDVNDNDMIFVVQS